MDQPRWRLLNHHPHDCVLVIEWASDWGHYLLASEPQKYEQACWDWQKFQTLHLLQKNKPKTKDKCRTLEHVQERVRVTLTFLMMYLCCNPDCSFSVNWRGHQKDAHVARYWLAVATSQPDLACMNTVSDWIMKWSKMAVQSDNQARASLQDSSTNRAKEATASSGSWRSTM